MQIQFLNLLPILHSKIGLSDPVWQSSFSSDHTETQGFGVSTSQTNTVYCFLPFSSADIFYNDKCIYLNGPHKQSNVYNYLSHTGSTK